MVDPIISINQSTLFMAILLAALGVIEYFKLEKLKRLVYYPAIISTIFFLKL
jgi:hypothetical protein